MIDRHSDLRWVRAALKRSRVVALLGPRQSGKSTLARQSVSAESLGKRQSWATHQGAEIDLVLFKNRRRVGVVCKRADAPVITSSMRIALADLKIDELRVVYSGSKCHPLAKNVEVVPQAELVNAK